MIRSYKYFKIKNIDKSFSIFFLNNNKYPDAVEGEVNFKVILLALCTGHMPSCHSETPRLEGSFHTVHT